LPKGNQVRRDPARAGGRPGAAACPRAPGEQYALLCVTEAAQLQATALTRTLGWAKIADGRRIHHLRHIAGCLWLARGVDQAFHYEPSDRAL
jgi:hypothetical protein